MTNQLQQLRDVVNKYRYGVKVSQIKPLVLAIMPDLVCKQDLWRDSGCDYTVRQDKGKGDIFCKANSPIDCWMRAAEIILKN